MYDIGIGAPNIDACVVTREPGLSEVLDQSVGRSIWDEDNRALPAIKESSPTRLFRSRVAEVRVHQHIGSRNGRPTPSGPHTHVIRDLLRVVHPQDARIPVPDGRCVVLSMHPPHPTRDELGRARPFDWGHWQAFQSLLDDYGPASYALAKRGLLAAATSDFPCPVPDDPRLARVLLPQLPHLGVPDDRLAELAGGWNLSHILDAVRADSTAELNREY